MSDDWDDGDYDGDYDEDNEFDDEATGLCPECRAEMHIDAEMCPSCGHWLSTTERHAMWSGGAGGLMGVGKVVLVVVLVFLMLGLVVLLR